MLGLYALWDVGACQHLLHLFPCCFHSACSFGVVNPDGLHSFIFQKQMQKQRTTPTPGPGKPGCAAGFSEETTLPTLWPPGKIERHKAHGKLLVFL